MRNILLALAAAGTLAAAAATPAEAAGGCGPYGHRSVRGFCVRGGEAGYGYHGGFYGPGYSRFDRYHHFRRRHFY